MPALSFYLLWYKQALDFTCFFVCVCCFFLTLNGLETKLGVKGLQVEFLTA